MKNLKSLTEFNSQLTAAGSRLVVVDFFAEWCGPCKTLAPILANLETKHKPSIFAKVDVDEAGDIAAKYEVKAMPTIIFFVGQSEVARVVGADVAQIQSLIKKHETGDAFSGAGSGQTLGGGGGAMATTTTTTTTSTDPSKPVAVEGPGGSCQIQVRMLDGSVVRGNFEPTNTVQEVYDFVRANLDARGVQAPGFVLMTQFPKVVYENEALAQSLQEAKLTPRAQLIVRA
ncbi:hypothetical protein BGX29_007481 [Mortierella sp. GBA35]|nr:hypothetical protein BGX23_007384 [Mortierella sp. AD031]KAF9098692.1 hypothetical protein BGX29_007481 [Mortierella sp. GBA35]KAG0212429.1 hypothetical protein BGX33_003648 [Mortierella sp. NVP41]